MDSARVECAVETEHWVSDVAPFDRWEATCELFPDILGVGESESDAVEDFVGQLTARSYH